MGARRGDCCVRCDKQGFVHRCQIMGESASEARRSQRRHCSGGKQGRLDSRRKVDYEEAHAYAEENGILHQETSAKTAVNVKQLFVAIANKLPKNPPQPEGEAFPVLPPTPKQKQGC